MTSAQVVETSVTNNSSFQNYSHPDDHTIRTTDTPGFKPFTKKEFEKFLMGKSVKLIRNVYEFYKYSPADYNKRSPAVGLPQYPDYTSIQLVGFQKPTVAQISGSTCGMVLKAEKTTLLPTTAGRLAPSILRATVT